MEQGQPGEDSGGGDAERMNHQHPLDWTAIPFAMRGGSGGAVVPFRLPVLVIRPLAMAARPGSSSGTAALAGVPVEAGEFVRVERPE
jgi:hypothetical protein